MEKNGDEIIRLFEELKKDLDFLDSDEAKELFIRKFTLFLMM